MRLDDSLGRKPPFKGKSTAAVQHWKGGLWTICASGQNLRSIKPSATAAYLKFHASNHLILGTSVPARFAALEWLPPRQSATTPGPA
jgi:hypothetical protein